MNGGKNVFEEQENTTHATHKSTVKLRYINAHREKKRHTIRIFLIKKKVTSAAQFRSQGGVALYLGAKPKIRASVAGKEKNGERSVQACSTSN